MAGQDLAMRILIRAQDGASGVLHALTGRVAQLGAALAAFFGLRSLASYLTDAVDSAAQLQRELGILQQVSGASAAELAQLKAAAEAVAASSLPYTARQAAAAEVELAKAGLSARDVVAALAPTLAMASAGQMEVSASAAIVTRTLSTFGLAAAETARVTNTLVAGANASNTSVQGLAEALSYAGPIAAATGYSLQEMTAAIGLMANRGIDASRAGTALGSILSQLADPASAASQALSAMGVTSRDLESAIGALATGSPMAQKAILAFGLEAGPGLRSLIAGGSAGLAEMGAKVQGLGEESAKAAQAMQNNLLGAVGALGSLWATIKARLGEGLLGPLERETRALTEALGGWLASGQLEKLRDGLVAAFEGASAALRTFVGELDIRARLEALTGWMQASGAAIKGWGAQVLGVKEEVSRGFAGVEAVFQTFGAGIHAVAAALASALELVYGGVNGMVKAANALGLVSDETLAKSTAVWESLGAAAATNAQQVGESLAAAAAAAERAAGTQTAAAQATTAATQAQTAAAQRSAEALSLTADQLDALGEGYSQAANGAVSLSNAAVRQVQAQQQASEALAAARKALDEETAAMARGEAVTLTWNAATGQWVTAAQQQVQAAEAAARAIGQESTAQGQAAQATENATLAAGRAARALAEQQLARERHRQALEAEATALAGQTRLLDTESQARVTHLQNLIKEAQARGDTAGAARLEIELSQAQIAGAVAVAAAKQQEADAALAVATALAQEAAADRDLSPEKQAAITAAQQSATAKQQEAAAASEQARALQAQAAAVKQGAQSAGQAVEQTGQAAQGAAASTQTFTVSMAQLAAQAGASTAGLGAFTKVAQEYFDAHVQGAVATGASLPELARAALLVGRAAQAMDGLKSAQTDLTGAYQRGELGLAAYLAGLSRLEGQASGAGAATSELGRQTLQGLREALKAAREQMESFTTSARDGLRTLQQEWAGLNGQTAERIRLEQGAERLKIEQDLARARKDGNQSAVQTLKEQLALHDRITSKLLANDRADSKAKQQQAAEAKAQQRASAVAPAATPSASTPTGPATPQASTPATPSAVPSAVSGAVPVREVVRINLSLGAAPPVNLDVTPGQETDLLAAIRRAGLSSR